MDIFYNFFTGFSLQNILTLGSMLYWLKSHLETKIDKITEKLEIRINQNEMRIEESHKRADQLYSTLIDLLKSEKKQK